MKRFLFLILAALLLVGPVVAPAQAGFFTLVNSDIQSPTITRRVSTLAELKLVDIGRTSIPAIQLMGRVTEGDGGEGILIKLLGDQSANPGVVADTIEGVFVKPTTPGDGSTGVWIRVFRGATHVRWFGATGDGVSDDTLACQAAVDYVQNILAGGVVYFDNGTYNITSALTQTVGHGVFFKGNGRASIIQNNTSGNTLELGDGITQFNDCGVTDLFITNSVAGGACILARKRTNLTVSNNVIQSSGTSGFGVKMEEGWGSKINKNTFQASKGFGVHLDETHNCWVTGNRMDGNPLFASVGVSIQNTSSPTVTGNVIESYGGAAVYVGTQTKSLALNNNYYEDNANIGVTFTGSEARTIKSDIILNGGAFPELSNVNPVRGVSVNYSYFQPLSSSQESSIYLAATDGFSEKGNRVAQAYNVAGASFIRTKNDSSFYTNTNTELGNSSVEGFPADKYFDVENINISASNKFQEDSLTSILINPKFAPRVDSHERLNPSSYSILSFSTTTLLAEISTSRHQGRQCFDVTRSGVGSSHFYGDTVLESDHKDFWGGELWLAYFEVKAITNNPGFELFVDVDGQRVFSGGGSATIADFRPRTVVFKPVVAADINVGYRMTGGTGADVVQITRPVVCPLGSLAAMNIIDIPGLLTFTIGDDTPSVKDGTVFKKPGGGVINDFDDGLVGQTVHILATDSYTVVNSASIVLNGGINFPMTSGDTLTLTMFNDQVWSEVGRSVN